MNENENDEVDDGRGVRFDQVPTAPQIFPILQNEGILALILLFNSKLKFLIRIHIYIMYFLFISFKKI